MPSDDHMWSTLGFAFELGYLIAIPIVVLAIGGRLFDRWLGTSPWLLLAGILLSLVVSSVLVTRKAREVISNNSQTAITHEPRMGTNTTNRNDHAQTD